MKELQDQIKIIESQHEHNQFDYKMNELNETENFFKVSEFCF